MIIRIGWMMGACLIFPDLINQVKRVIFHNICTTSFKPVHLGWYSYEEMNPKLGRAIEVTSTRSSMFTRFVPW